jgi:dipeptidyl aminopeptidase/acylaminoacyl peptidase
MPLCPRVCRLGGAVLVILFFLAPVGLWADQPYQKPPKNISDILDAPATPAVSVSPARDRLLLVQGVRYPPVADLAQPMLRLAGLRINPQTNGPHHPPRHIALTLQNIADDKQQSVTVPDHAYLSTPAWSPDGKHFTFTNTTASGIELWVGDAETAKAHRVAGIAVNAAYGEPVQWLPDSQTLLVQTVVAERGPPPAAPPAPAGPIVQESSGKPAPVRTFQDMLQNPHDEDLFDYYATSQLVLLDSKSGTATPLGKPAVYRATEASPDGQHLLVIRTHRPYSYLLPASAFPHDIEIWARSGKLEYTLARLPLADQVPIEGVPTGPRSPQWRATEPATLVWVEALDDGDPKKKVAHRDRVRVLQAPFQGEPAELAKTEHRFTGLSWGEKNSLALLRDYDRDRRWGRTFLLNADKPDESPRLLWERSVQDRYHDPGTPILRRLPTGPSVLWQHGDSIFLHGPGASPQGDRPFLDRLNLTTQKTERLFQSREQQYESVVTLIADDGSRFLTQHESNKEPPNFFLRSAGSDSPRVLTHFSDPAPQLRGITKQLVTYKRADGVPLSFTLYLPPDYQQGERLPTVVWAYPREYNDADTAGQVAGSPYRFTSIGGPSHLFFLLQGYAILDDAALPVIGDPETANNTYLDQIVAGAKAAIDKAVDLGVTDRNRVGVGGHSYGAFMTANLLAHSDLFRAGIARSGAYNRTLTPFGFQSERRTVWEAPDLYLKMSPFLAANKIKAPLLLIHGEADNNPGTFPIQSERMYQAVRGNGGTVRYVVLPHEAHGYAARESIDHTLYEMISWFDKHVKNAPH